MPKRTIYKYYNLLDKHQTRDAWNLLSPQCQIRWSDGFKDYNEGYSTLATTKILNIDNYNPGKYKRGNSF